MNSASKPDYQPNSAGNSQGASTVFGPPNSDGRPNSFPYPVGFGQPGMPDKKSLPVGLILGLIAGAVVLLSALVIGAVNIFGGKVDYEATYDSLRALDDRIDDIDYGDCYKMYSDFDDSYTTNTEYQQYAKGCLAEFSAAKSAVDDFAKTSGAKHNKDIKGAFESFKQIFNSIYSNSVNLEAQLAVYVAYHEFYLTIDEADVDAKSFEQAIMSAASVLQGTNNKELMAFASEFREHGLVYIRAVEAYQNNPSSSMLYSEARAALSDFADYVDDNIPDVIEVSGFDFAKMADFEDAYNKLYDTTRDAYYDSL